MVKQILLSSILLGSLVACGGGGSGSGAGDADGADGADAGAGVSTNTGILTGLVGVKYATARDCK